MYCTKRTDNSYATTHYLYSRMNVTGLKNTRTFSLFKIQAFNLNRGGAWYCKLLFVKKKHHSKTETVHLTTFYRIAFLYPF